MLEITKRFGRGHEAPLAIVPLIVGEYGCWYPFNAAQVNIETDLGVEAVGRERRRCFRRCSDELHPRLPCAKQSETLTARPMSRTKAPIGNLLGFLR
jgi:hypothetical protein